MACLLQREMQKKKLLIPCWYLYYESLVLWRDEFHVLLPKNPGVVLVLLWVMTEKPWGIKRRYIYFFHIDGVSFSIFRWLFLLFQNALLVLFTVVLLLSYCCYHEPWVISIKLKKHKRFSFDPSSLSYWTCSIEPVWKESWEFERGRRLQCEREQRDGRCTPCSLKTPINMQIIMWCSVLRTELLYCIVVHELSRTWVHTLGGGSNTAAHPVLYTYGQHSLVLYYLWEGRHV